MASTFTLKRKTYTEFDYNNDIASAGFRDGLNYALQKMYVHPWAAGVLREAANGPGAHLWAGKFGAEEALNNFLKKQTPLPDPRWRQSLDYGIGRMNKSNPELGEKYYKSFKNGYRPAATGQAAQGNFGPSRQIA
jgi:hypothetical protein